MGDEKSSNHTTLGERNDDRRRQTRKPNPRRSRDSGRSGPCCRDLRDPVRLPSRTSTDVHPPPDFRLPQPHRPNDTHVHAARYNCPCAAVRFSLMRGTAQSWRTTDIIDRRPVSRRRKNIDSYAHIQARMRTHDPRRDPQIPHRVRRYRSTGPGRCRVGRALACPCLRAGRSPKPSNQLSRYRQLFWWDIRKSVLDRADHQHWR